MASLELTVLAIALLLSTINISVYSWFDTHETQLNIGIWVIRVIAVLPGLVFIVWALYAMASNKDATLAMALLTSGIMLTGGAIQLLSLLVRKQQMRPGSQPDFGQ